MESAENNVIVDVAGGEKTENIVSEEERETMSSGEIKSSTFGFTEPSWRSDFCLVVEGTKLYVAKIILSLASPVFDTMFQSDFKEKSCDELELPGKKLSDVVEFLRCIYPDTIGDVNRDNAMTILPLVEEYQVLQLKPRCDEALIDGVTEETLTDKLLEMLKQACMYDLKKLRVQCIFLLSSRPCVMSYLNHRYCKSFPSADALNEIFTNVDAFLKNKLAELEQVAEENQLFKQSMNSDSRDRNLKKSTGDTLKRWDYTTIVLFVSVPRDSNSKCDFENNGKIIDMWGVPFKINTSVWRNKLTLDVENIGTSKVICDVSVHCTLVNRQPNGRNHVIVENGNTKYGDKCSFEINPMSSCMHIDNGYILNGKIGLIVQLYMSKPNIGQK